LPKSAAAVCKGRVRIDWCKRNPSQEEDKLKLMTIIVKKLPMICNIHDMKKLAVKQYKIHSCKTGKKMSLKMHRLYAVAYFCFVK
jgi:hypothetical protein